MPALEKHGLLGDGCWEVTPCNKRRTYYRHHDRYNRSRRLRYVGDKESAQQLDGISIPTIPAVVIHFLRQRKDKPLHALGVKLWVGQQKKSAIEPAHTLGWTEGQVKAYIRDAIKQFSEKYAVQISGIAATVELHPNVCPILPCPLKINSSEVE